MNSLALFKTVSDMKKKGVTNFVTGGKTKSVKLPCGLPLHKKYAAAGNRLFRFPYIG